MMKGHNHDRDDYVLHQSHIFGDMASIVDLGDFILDDPYLYDLIRKAVESRTRMNREKAIIKIIWYIRALSLMAGFREGIKRYGNAMKSR